MKKIISLHDFEYLEILEELAGRQTDRLSAQDKELLKVVARRFRDIVCDVIEEQLGPLRVNRVVPSQVNEVTEK